MRLQTPLHETSVTRMKTFWRSCSTINDCLSPATSVPSTAKVHMNTTVNVRDKCIIQQTRHQTSIEANCNRCVTTEVQQLRPVQGGKLTLSVNSSVVMGVCVGSRRRLYLGQRNWDKLEENPFIKSNLSDRLLVFIGFLLGIHCGINILKQNI